MFRILFAFLLLLSFPLFSQVNTQLLGELDLPNIHSTQLNDVWGYVDEDGNEYALVGAQNGTAVVDVSDPANPVEVFWEPGMNSVWRDIKTFGDYAYVTTEAENGLLIIDLGPLPQSTVLPTHYYTGPSGDEWESAHNLYVDNTSGFGYIFGANRDNGGLIILDLNPNPTQPEEVGSFENWYSHDGFVRNDTAFLAHISDGIISVVDVTDLANPQLLGTQTTPTNLSHNIWSTDDNNYVYTTDETPGGYLTAFDVNDPSSIQEIDKVKVFPDDQIIPHNTHVFGDYIVTSYYTAGVRIHDITQRDNMIEVASYDTSPLDSPTYNGCWGVYPYLPSGNVLATDIEEGLFILGVTYEQAAYLEGNVKDADNGNNLVDVKVKINGGSNVDKFTSIQGDYTTGTAKTGTYNVVYTKVGYDTLVVENIQLTKDSVTVIDTVMEPLPTYPVTVNVFELGTGNPIQGAQVSLSYPIIDYLETTNGLGEVSVDFYYSGNYEVIAGKWGYKTTCQTFNFDTLNSSFDLYLKKEYYDDFSFDFGWSSISTADRGDWVRVVPIPEYDSFAETYESPETDVTTDCGNYAYMTGNGALTNTDVKNGVVTLISPVFDLTDYTDPYISLETFFFNFHGFDPPNDSLNIFLSNGNSIEMLDFVTATDSIGVWVNKTYRVEDIMTPTPFMQLSVVTSDFNDTENITKGGIDRFHITDGNPVSTDEIQSSNYMIYPNPANDYFKWINVPENLPYQILGVDGSLILRGNTGEDRVDISALNNGMYIVVIENSDVQLKLIKK